MRIKYWSLWMLIISIPTMINAQSKQGLNDEFLIGIFWPPVWKHTNDQQYNRLKEAGVDIIQNVSSTDLYTEAKNLVMLELAHKNGLKILVADPRVHQSDDSIVQMVNTYKDHPALAGYYIMDEPDTARLQWCADTYHKILQADPTKMAHVNLFPVYALGGQLGNINYEREYVERWIEMVGPRNLEYLSFDHYPFSSKGTFRESYYHNLDIIRRAGLKYNIKTSAYLQSMGIPGAFKRPNENELRYNVYSMLAYGIKQPVWFTYWTPTGQGEKFLPAVIDSNGNKTDLYLPFQQLNKEMKQLGKTLIHLDAKVVYHTGMRLPESVSALPGESVIKPNENEDLIFAFFEHRENKSKHVMVVNKSYHQPKKVTFSLDAALQQVTEISKAGNRNRKHNIGRDHRFSESFMPGEGKLYLLQ
ncbi:MAG: hypothetical protein ACTHLE_20215 [Agriterribacter sp.]